MANEALKACPFCRGAPSIHPERGAMGAWISCAQCGLEGPTETGVTEEDAAAHWNTRATLSSDAVAGGEPVAWRAYCGGYTHTSRPEIAAEWGKSAEPLYATPPETAQLLERVKELENADETRARDISRLMVERDAVRDALTELDQLRDRVKELEKALEPFANEAAQWTEYEDDEPLVEMWENCPDSALTVGMLRTARRVREGGKVDG